MLNWTISNNGYKAKIGPWLCEVQVDGMRKGKTCCGLVPPTNEELAKATRYTASFTGLPGRIESGFTDLEKAKEAAEELATIAIYAAASQLDLV